MLMPCAVAHGSSSFKCRPCWITSGQGPLTHFNRRIAADRPALLPPMCCRLNPVHPTRAYTTLQHYLCKAHSMHMLMSQSSFATQCSAASMHPKPTTCLHGHPTQSMSERVHMSTLFFHIPARGVSDCVHAVHAHSMRASTATPSRAASTWLTAKATGPPAEFLGAAAAAVVLVTSGHTVCASQRWLGSVTLRSSPVAQSLRQQQQQQQQPVPVVQQE
ncbi:hypothetical protein COO60DRAFT_220763 [Scenedesmus sp. NREL 46B-D3]|nr:hypothetical protein COO60DRAFT_220763 [Scenedesmus sp. NREL 46B-D3]